MPDPISCNPTSQNPSIIQCDDVVIGPEPDVSPTVVAPGEPAVRALVERFTSGVIVRREEHTPSPIGTPVAEITKECGTKLIGVGLAAAGGQGNPVLAVISTFKAAIELAKCVVETNDEVRQEAAEALAIERCEANGGIATGEVGNTLICERLITDDSQ